MSFLEISVSCETQFTEIYIAELSAIGFDAFVENESGFAAYIEQPQFDQASLTDIVERYKDIARLEYQLKPVEKQNWNEVWERNYEPIFIDDQCVVKASFHDIPKKYPYEITINPKMSFGTGHHETTYLMLKTMLTMDLEGKKVLDVGCGTGILAIMSQLMKASTIEACDIDEWCVENSRENIALNQCDKVNVKLGDVTSIEGKFDVILANINRNVLLHDIPYYAELLGAKGKLLLSGFYKDDVPIIKKLAEDQDFRLSTISNKHNWSCVLFEK